MKRVKLITEPLADLEMQTGHALLGSGKSPLPRAAGFDRDRIFRGDPHMPETLCKLSEVLSSSGRGADLRRQGLGVQCRGTTSATAPAECWAQGTHPNHP